MEYGLTDTGFIVKPFTVILQEAHAAFQAEFGTDLDLSDESIEGVYIKNQSLKLSQLWELLGKLYTIGDVDDAFGIYLDRIVNLVNVRRMPARATEVYECLWAAEGTVVQKGHLLRMSNGQTFKLTSTVTVGNDALLGFQVVINTVTAGHAYQFSLDTCIIAYTAQDGDDEEHINAGLAAALETVFPGVYEADNRGTDGLYIHARAGTIAFALSSIDELLTFPLLGAYARYVCTKTGSVVVSVGALNEIVNRINGLTAVINYARGMTGRDMESDAEVRMHLAARQRRATANEIAIQNAILAITGVRYAKVYSNRDSVEVKGRPPKSFEAVVVGGDDQEIAEVIFDKGPAGIQAFGTTHKGVKDAEGFEWDIAFSRPAEQYIWINIVCSRNDEESLNPNWITQIRDTIEAWGSSHLDVAVDLVYQKLFRPLYETPGIGFADITVAVTDTLTPPPDAAYHAANIEIGEGAIGMIDRSRIAVTESTTS